MSLTLNWISGFQIPWKLETKLYVADIEDQIFSRVNPLPVVWKSGIKPKFTEMLVLNIIIVIINCI